MIMPVFVKLLLLKIVAAETNNVRILRNLGIECSRLGLYQESLIWVERACRLDANDVKSREIRGFTLLTLGRHKEGWKEYNFCDPIDKYFSCSHFCLKKCR